MEKNETSEEERDYCVLLLWEENDDILSRAFGWTKYNW